MEIPVNTDDLLALIGKLYVEAEFLRRELVALQAQLAAATPDNPAKDAKE